MNRFTNIPKPEYVECARCEQMKYYTELNDVGVCKDCEQELNEEKKNEDATL